VLARAGKNPRVVVEATYGWYWVANVLQEAGAEVHLAHPLGVRVFTCRRVKDDERDCADLADLLRLGRLPEGWIAPPQVRQARELTRYRIKLVRLPSSAKDQVHAVLAKLGIPVPCSDLFGAFAGVAGRTGPAPALWRQGRLAAAADREADQRDQHARGGDRRPRRQLPALPGGAAAARNRVGAGRDRRSRGGRGGTAGRLRPPCRRARSSSRAGASTTAFGYLRRR
jgi:transposase